MSYCMCQQVTNESLCLLYISSLISAIDCDNQTWHVTNSSIQGMIEGLFTNATASNGSKTYVSGGGGNASWTGLYPGATYVVSLVYEKNDTVFPQCSHNLTISKYKSYHNSLMFVYLSNQHGPSYCK